MSKIKQHYVSELVNLIDELQQPMPGNLVKLKYDQFDLVSSSNQNYVGVMISVKESPLTSKIICDVMWMSPLKSSSRKLKVKWAGPR